MAIGTPVNQGHNQGSSVGSLSVTTLATIATGDFILIVVGNSTSGQAITAVTDPAGNTYTIVAGGGSTAISFAYCANATGFAAGAVAITFGGTSRHSAQIFSVSGMSLVTATVRDTNATPATTTGTSNPAATSQTTGARAQAASLLIGALYTAGNDPGTFTPGGSFTALGGTTATDFLKTAYQIVSDANPVAWAPAGTNNVVYRSSVQIFRAPTPSARPDGMLTGVGM